MKPLSMGSRIGRLWRNTSAPTLFVGSFAILIAIGTLGLLVLPGLYTGPRLGVVDAFFTITSAVCVTGLTVVDTATYFTRWGQLWLLLFIQLGGLGLVTLTSLIIGVMGRRLSLRSEMIAGPPVEISHRSDLLRLARSAARFTFAIEGIGALLIFLILLPSQPPLEAAWHAVFHGISAFCNAGLSTFSENLISRADHGSLLTVISGLVVIGGFGYLSSSELNRWWRAGGLRGNARLSTHTFAALWVTVTLLSAGTFLFALFEWNGVLGEMAFIDKWVNAWFLSATRTAGFASVDFGDVSNSTAYFTMLLMVVGGSPGSTAGGIKTTAMAVLVALALSRIRGRRVVEIHDRSIPEGTVERTVSLALLAFAVMTAGVFWLSFTETTGETLEEARAAFLPLFFEVVSAFGTAGLSMDVTPTLSTFGKLSVAALMFVGRVGPLSFFAAISLRGRAETRAIRSAREDVIIG